MNTIKNKIIHEKLVIYNMIAIYCKENHSNNICLCKDCNELLEYSNKRIEKCPKLESKTFCSNCQSPCYDNYHRQKIKTIMRYSGPRIIFKHPITAIKHLFLTLT